MISDPFEAQELANHVRDSLTGGSSMRMEVDAGGAAVLLRTLPPGSVCVGSAFAPAWPVGLLQYPEQHCENHFQPQF